MPEKKIFEKLKSIKIDSKVNSDGFPHICASNTKLYAHVNFDKPTLDLLLKFAKECDIKSFISDMFAGKLVNKTEGRKALHMACRGVVNKKSNLIADKEIKEEVEREKKKFDFIANKIHKGEFVGKNKTPIKHIVNIGIGGSFLGSRFVSEALKDYCNKDLDIHFLANLDFAVLNDILEKINLAETLFIVVSKSLTTLDVKINTNSVIHILRDNGFNNEQIKEQFIYITARTDKLPSMGWVYKQENILQIWDWVGGRFSIWSSIGLSVAGMMGVKNFNEFLAGGLEIDEHINKAEDKDNLPLNLALIAFWYRNICRKDTQTIIPYSHRLRSFVPFCKQLEMESNGKTITNNKEKTKIDTGYVVWGGEGTNGQHSYHQLLHQGSDWHPIDFVLPLKDSPILSKNGLNRNHKNHMVSSCLSQIEVLSNGYNKGNVFQNLEGNRPSNLLTLEDISPKSIGNLIAIYEYKTIYLSIFWDINPFDQWGVEHSKVTEDSISSRENISKFNKTILDLYDL